MKRTILATAIFLLGVSGFAQQMATGYVFEDQNENGKKDRNESGIANVSVSNSQQVVVTDTNGKYEIPVGDDNIIFVIKPSGYVPKINENKTILYVAKNTFVPGEDTFVYGEDTFVFGEDTSTPRPTNSDTLTSPSDVGIDFALIANDFELVYGIFTTVFTSSIVLTWHFWVEHAPFFAGLILGEVLG